MKELVVHLETGDGHCECCGYYSWERSRITVDGEEVAQYLGDSHMGRPEGMEHALAAALNALGYSVRVEHADYTEHLGRQA
jgi:hypothetical protein